MSIRRDTIYNLSGALIPFAITLVTLPTFLGLIGESRYGVMAIAWVLLGYFGLFDLGIARATAQHVAQLDRAPATDRSDIVWTALIAVAVLGVVGALLLGGVGYLVFSQIAIENDALRVEVRTALPWLSLAIPVILGASALSGALQGREKFLSLNVVQGTISSLALILPLMVAAAGHVALGWLIPAALAPRVLGIVVLFDLCQRHVPLRGRVAFSAGGLRSLFGYGGWITVSAVVGPLLAVADRLIIGKMLGASAVTYYTIPHGLVWRGVVFAGSLASAIFPRFATRTTSERDELMNSASGALALTITPLVFSAIWLVDPFFRVWLGHEIASQSAPVAEILLSGLWLNSLAHMPHARLQGEGNPRTVAAIHLAELVPYAFLLWVLLSAYGIVGAALAWTARAAIDALLLLALSGAPMRNYQHLLAPCLVIACSSITTVVLLPSSPLRWILCVVLLGIMGLWAAREARKVFRRLLRDQSKYAGS